MDNRTLFTGKAADYAAARPSYAPALIDILYARHGFSPSSRIADVGAGTGKFSELLVKRGSTVYAVEPNDDMRAYCLRNLNQTTAPLPSKFCSKPSAGEAFLTLSR